MGARGGPIIRRTLPAIAYADGYFYYSDDDPLKMVLGDSLSWLDIPGWPAEFLVRMFVGLPKRHVVAQFTGDRYRLR